MTSFADPPRLPAIDLSLFDVGDPWRDHVAAQVDWAAAEFGFFQLVGHGIDAGVSDSLLALGGRLFAEGESVRLGNSIPEQLGVRDTVLDFTNALTGLGHKLMASIGRGLRLGDNYFVDHYTGDAETRFRVFSHPPASRARSSGVEQSDEGLLTLQSQDDVGGLQIRHGTAWLDVPYVPGSILVSVGDALERLTGGRYRSAVYRVVNRSARARISLQFFFDVRRGVELSPIFSRSPRAAVRGQAQSPVPTRTAPPLSGSATRPRASGRG